MQRLKLPLSSIKVEDRQRQDLGDITELAASLRQYGLIQPIVVDQSNRLIAGGRRYAAAQQLNWTDIDVVFRETLDEAELTELELEENVRRKSMSWQEKCLAVAKIHTFKRRRSIQEGHDWGMRDTATVTGDSLGSIYYNIELARKLADRSSAYWKCDSLKSAWDLRMREDEDIANAKLLEFGRQNHQPITPNAPSQEEIHIVEVATANPDALAEEREKYYSNPLNPPGSFDAYWAEKLAAVDTHKRTIYLTNRFVLGDSVAFMRDATGMFDHILTDIPYAIDMENLSQDLTAVKDIDTVEKEHDVDSNVQLIKDFFPAAFNCTNDKAFVVTWGDQMLWQLMYDCAVAAGFKVQRWPYIWLKPTGMNNCAAYNQTKATEIAIICRKPGATLVNPIARNYSPVCTSEEAKTLTGHPFAKPFETTEELANAISIEGQKVLDPFAGRGSIVLKLLSMKRSAFGCELNVAHYNALIENLKQHYLSYNPNTIFK